MLKVVYIEFPISLVKYLKIKLAIFLVHKEDNRYLIELPENPLG